MMTYNGMNAGKAEEYFEHELDYYTGDISNYDRWHGILAAEMGLEGELSKKQFDDLINRIAK